jgi:O-antigen chain-terminating methyltransferase
MENSIFEIRDNEIDVNGIMDKIRENIRKRTEDGVNPPDPNLICSPSIGDISQNYNSDVIIQQDLSFINSNWDINNNNYSIHSHRPFFGRFLVKGRQAINGEVRRYIDPMISRQTEFNEHSSKLQNFTFKTLDTLEGKSDALEGKFDALEGKSDALEGKSDVLGGKFDVLGGKFDALEGKFDALEGKFDALEGKFDALEGKFDALEGKFDALEKSQKQLHYQNIAFVEDFRKQFYLKMEKNIRVFLSQMDKDLEKKAWLANLFGTWIEAATPDKVLQLSLLENQENIFNYDKFTREISKIWVQESGASDNESNFFEDSAKVFSNCNNVIDIGCGKGYFLELLKNHNIGSYGIDIDSEFVQYCQEQGLIVYNVDAITHLKSLEDNSLDGIFMCQLVEHLDFALLCLLLKLSYQKIKAGCSVIISTPNILSIHVSSNLFYLDPSHKTHIHPEVLKFLLVSCGFNNIQDKYYQPVPNNFKLREIDQTSIQNANQEIIEIYNSNIECLNKLLFGARDYVAIATK